MSDGGPRIVDGPQPDPWHRKPAVVAVRYVLVALIVVGAVIVFVWWPPESCTDERVTSPMSASSSPLSTTTPPAIAAPSTGPASSVSSPGAGTTSVVKTTCREADAVSGFGLFVLLAAFLLLLPDLAELTVGPLSFKKEIRDAVRQQETATTELRNLVQQFSIRQNTSVVVQAHAEAARKQFDAIADRWAQRHVVDRARADEAWTREMKEADEAAHARGTGRHGELVRQFRELWARVREGPWVGGAQIDLNSVEHRERWEAYISFVLDLAEPAEQLLSRPDQFDDQTVAKLVAATRLYLQSIASVEPEGTRSALDVAGLT
jgi:hypothetical protein